MKKVIKEGGGRGEDTQPLMDIFWLCGHIHTKTHIWSYDFDNLLNAYGSISIDPTLNVILSQRRVAYVLMCLCLYVGV